jgi:mitochondrial fission protein ELM1
MRIWVLVDDKPGNTTQSLGVAEALAARHPDSQIELKTMELGPLSRLPNRLLGARLCGYDAPSRAGVSAAPYPDIAIAAGRRLVPALRAIKKANPATRIIYLMHPQVPLSEFDLVAMPAHDNPPNLPNVMVTSGAVHRKLAPHNPQADARFTAMPHPRILLLAGGNTGDCYFAPADWRCLGRTVAHVAATHGGSVMATTSRRTGEEATNALAEALPEGSYFHRWSAEGVNPYHAMLAASDVLVVTGESMSMISEACAMGVPVLLFVPAAGVSAKHARFHAQVLASGHARMLDANSQVDWTPPAPLDEAGRVAERILAMGVK